MNSQPTLIIRLSSMGDVILASSALEASGESLNLDDGKGARCDWLVAEEFADLLKGHPRVGKVWCFNRNTGIAGWVRICRTLWEARYQRVFDLHRSLRTAIAQFLFRWWDLKVSFLSRTSEHTSSKWVRVSKERFFLVGFFVFKKIWPRRWRPRPWVERFSLLLGGRGSERPRLHYLSKIGGEGELLPRSFLGRYLCVMPSSRWKGKEWATENYLEIFRNLSVFPVVLGTERDEKSLLLVELFKSSGITHFSGVGKWGLSEVAGVLTGSRGYLGVDTGLAHLAEAVGVPAYVVYGPTDPGMGFGPWREESEKFMSSLWCRPCGKDGRYCFRPTQRYRCLSDLGASSVFESLSSRVEALK